MRLSRQTGLFTESDSNLAPLKGQLHEGLAYKKSNGLRRAKDMASGWFSESKKGSWLNFSIRIQK